jgi:hypothetical protein
VVAPSQMPDGKIICQLERLSNRKKRIIIPRERLSIPRNWGSTCISGDRIYNDSISRLCFVGFHLSIMEGKYFPWTGTGSKSGEIKNRCKLIVAILESVIRQSD